MKTRHLGYLNSSEQANLQKARGFKVAYELIYREFLQSLNEGKPSKEIVHLIIPCKTLFFKAVELYLRNFLLIKDIEWGKNNEEGSRKIMNTTKNNGDAHDLYALWKSCSQYEDFPNSKELEEKIKYAGGSDKNYSGVAYSESPSAAGIDDLMFMDLLDVIVKYKIEQKETIKKVLEEVRKYEISKNASY
jgi:hypothetical protein